MLNGTVNATCQSELNQTSTISANCTGPFALAKDGSCKIRCPRKLLGPLPSLSLKSFIHPVAPVWTRHDHVEFAVKLMKILSPISLASMIVCISLVIIGSGLDFPNDLTVNFMLVILLSQLQLVVRGSP